MGHTHRHGQQPLTPSLAGYYSYSPKLPPGCLIQRTIDGYGIAITALYFPNSRPLFVPPLQSHRRHSSILNSFHCVWGRRSDFGQTRCSRD
ncbi:hypothetical protein VTN96DRAFT_2321 [Rasamsonia emersonii]